MTTKEESWHEEVARRMQRRIAHIKSWHGLGETR